MNFDEMMEQFLSDSKKVQQVANRKRKKNSRAGSYRGKNYAKRR